MPTPTLLDKIMRPIARDLLRKFGADATLIRYNRIGTGRAVTVPTVSTATIKVTPPERYEVRQQGLLTAPQPGHAGTQEAEAICYVAASDPGLIFTPDGGQMLDFGDGRSFDVVDVMPIQSGNRVVIYGLLLAGRGKVQEATA